MGYNENKYYILLYSVIYSYWWYQSTVCTSLIYSYSWYQSTVCTNPLYEPF